MSDPIHKRNLEYSADQGNAWEKDNQAGNEAYQASVKPEQFKVPGEFIFGRNLKWYWQAVKWPTLTMLAAEIICRFIILQYFADWSGWLEIKVNLIRIIIFIWLSLGLLNKVAADKKQLFTGVIMAGLLVGLAGAIFQLFWFQFGLWTIFNLIGQPLYVAVQGLIVALITFNIKQKH